MIEIVAAGNAFLSVNSFRNSFMDKNDIFEMSLYPTYDTFNGIHVDRVERIPQDYYDVMGVPITYLTKQRKCPSNGHFR